jgi:CRP-like cAMP-binding protein
LAVLREKANTTLRLTLLAHATQAREYLPGDFVFRQGDESCGIFFVKAGTVRSFAQNDLCTPVLEQIATEGCVLGLPATMSGEPYSLTAVAVEHSTLLHLSRESLDRLIREDRDVAMQLLSLLSAELRSVRGEIAKSRN